MKINRNNYEIFFIDYFDGNLNREEKEELLCFLSANPDLKDEFDEFEKYITAATEKQYKFKDELKKQISDLGPVSNDTIDEYSIAYLENDLNDSEKIVLLEAVNKNADFNRTFNLYQKTKFQPDETIIYSRKRQLKHFVIDRKLVFQIIGYASVAAILLLGIFIINPSRKLQPEQEHISEVVEKKEPVKIAPDSDNYQEEKINTIAENKMGLNSKVPKETIERIPIQNESAEIKKKEIIKLDKLKSKTLNSFDNHIQQSNIITKSTEISNIIAENETSSITNIQQEPKENLTENRKINLWRLAELGLKGFNKLNETNYEVKTNYTSSGKLKSVTFKTERRSITTPAI